jgi:hypothetical protein
MGLGGEGGLPSRVRDEDEGVRGGPVLTLLSDFD